MRHNQAKNHPKGKMLFSLLDMSIRGGHVHILELWKSFKFWAAVATEQLCRGPHLSVILVFLILDMHVRN